MISMLVRNLTAFNPPVVDKSNNALRFGVLGAAKIAPNALILPARSHPEVIIQAISARNRARAEEFARKHGIPDVRDTYQEILDDPLIDAVFIALPNSLHCEWAVRSIRAGKNVLLEKPSVTNEADAKLLFNMPELSQPEPPIILEAFHNRFHPALHKFLSYVTPNDVVNVHTDSMVPWWFTSKDDIDFKYNLGGGSIMSLGTYNFGVLRMIFKDEPEECLNCDVSIFGDGIHDQCDYSFRAQFRFPNGGIGEATTSLRGPLLWKPSEARVTHKEVVVHDKSLPPTQEKVRTRQVTLHGFMQAIVWHRIDVNDSFVIRDKIDHQPVSTWVESQSHKAYTCHDAGGSLEGLPSQHWWNSYRHQLEAFVNKVKGRQPHYWISGQDSVNQMRMIDLAYKENGLGLRPSSSFT